MTTARLFWNGRSQAVRLPKEYRFSGTEVEIHREGERIILEPPKKRPWPKGYFESWGQLSEDFELPPDTIPSPIKIDVDVG